MENFELIEKYISGQLTEVEKQNFEHQLTVDPSLKSDLALQEQIIAGIKKARASELKALLNQVPVGGGISSGISIGKIVAVAIASTAVVTGSYFYFKPNDNQPATKNTTKQEKPVIADKNVLPTKPVAEDKEEVKEKVNVVETKKLPSPAPAGKKTVPVNTNPKIDVIDPSAELSSSNTQTTEIHTADKNEKTISRIAVEVDALNKKYSFHYQFQDSKLILYGSFDKGLYEILEIHGDAHSVFLYYKDSYYLLNEKRSVITPLTAIKDAQLISQLKAYRSGQK
ncbi:MAG: hypothetical protein OJF59_002705 [Cytophagales bacterium]|jgi:hypothetical protein|nr:MAG: hypothetical protein OJF59_002705 [Cytophagales bacterium]